MEPKGIWNTWKIWGDGKLESWKKLLKLEMNFPKDSNLSISKRRFSPNLGVENSHGFRFHVKFGDCRWNGAFSQPQYSLGLFCQQKISAHGSVGYARHFFWVGHLRIQKSWKKRTTFDIYKKSFRLNPHHPPPPETTHSESTIFCFFVCLRRFGKKVKAGMAMGNFGHFASNPQQKLDGKVGPVWWDDLKKKKPW